MLPGGRGGRFDAIGGLGRFHVGGGLVGLAGCSRGLLFVRQCSLYFLWIGRFFSVSFSLLESSRWLWFPTLGLSRKNCGGMFSFAFWDKERQ